MRTKGRVSMLRRGLALAGAAFAAAMFATSPAFAGIGGSVVPSFPTPLNVGDIRTATIVITNNATAPNKGENVTASGIFFTPSCAASDGFTCSAPDPGVFQFASPTGRVGTACAGITFQVGPPDPGTGEIQLIPPVNNPVVLGPSDGSGKPRFCIINVNFQVLRVPIDSTPPGPPLTTDSLAHATLQGTTNTGAAAGGDTTVIIQPILALDKTPHAQTILAGDTATFTIVVTNNGTGTANAVTLNDPLPVGGGVVWALASQGPGLNCHVSAGSPQTLSCASFSLPAGQSQSVSVSATTSLEACTSMDNTATVTSSNNPNVPPAQANITCVVPHADLVITKDDGKTTVTPGSTTTYAVTVTNNGPNEVTGAIVTDPAPAAGLTLGNWTCAVSAAGSGGVVTTACGAAAGSGPLNTTANLKVGGAVTYMITATVTAVTGTVTNTASVAPPPLTVNPGTSCTAGTASNPRTFDPVTGTCTASDIDPIVPVADLVITKTDGKTVVQPNDVISYTVVATNNGPSPVSGAIITDPGPAGLTLGAWTCAVSNPGAGVGATTACGAASGSGPLNTTADLKAGGAVTYTIAATVTATTGSVTNTATITPPPGTTNPGTSCTTQAAPNARSFNAATGTCSASDTDTVTPIADLVITKTDGKTTVQPNDVISYTVVATNNGPSPVSGAIITDPGPAGLTLGAWTCAVSNPGAGVGATTACGAASGSGPLNTTADLKAGGAVTYTIAATVTATTGSVTNTATITPPLGTTNPGTSCTTQAAPNARSFNAATGTCSASDTDTVTPVADLVITKDDGKTTVTPGSTTTYAVTVTNNGPSEVTGAIVTDPAATGLTLGAWTCAVSVPGGGGVVTTACGAAAGSGPLNTTANLKVGGQVTYTIVATVTAVTGTVTNTANVAPPPLTVNPGTSCTAGTASNPRSFNPVTGTCSASDIDITPVTDVTAPKAKVIHNDSATLSGGTSPTGTLTFNLYQNTTCTGSPVFTNQVTVVAGTSTYSSGDSPQIIVAAGTEFRWVVTYSGDANNNGSTSTCGLERAVIAITP